MVGIGDTETDLMAGQPPAHQQARFICPDHEVKIADLLEALGQLALIADDQYPGHDDHADGPCCPHWGSTRTTLRLRAATENSY